MLYAGLCDAGEHAYDAIPKPSVAVAADGECRYGFRGSNRLQLRGVQLGFITS